MSVSPQLNTLIDRFERTLAEDNIKRYAVT